MAVRTEGRTKIVEEVCHHEEQDRLTRYEASVGDSCGEVGLATSMLSLEHQPSLRLFRELTGKAVGHFEVLLLLA
jgi:hypothetical protein